ncbi:winged helix-turn-helix domain-containing protein [Salinibaculum salinum]|uniref:winged helix-turn-helix domain-containing protein n=1 Tax=Salinibaculum salinum TaxID=3131996 RepID=UPI0030EE27A4
MSADETPESDDGDSSVDTAGGGSTGDVRQRIEREADRAIEQFDDGVVDVLGWLLDTETRARIYVFLRQHPQSTSEEVADGTGLYPSTVREALAELHEEDTVERQKRESDGAGNNPYEYSAIAPSELVGTVVGDVQDQLNAVCNLDRQFEDETAADDNGEPDDGPVTITVEDERGE